MNNEYLTIGKLLIDLLYSQEQISKIEKELNKFKVANEQKLDKSFLEHIEVTEDSIIKYSKEAIGHGPKYYRAHVKDEYENKKTGLEKAKLLKAHYLALKNNQSTILEQSTIVELIDFIKSLEDENLKNVLEEGSLLGHITTNQTRTNTTGSSGSSGVNNGIIDNEDESKEPPVIRL